jgi:hypothetical protein
VTLRSTWLEQPGHLPCFGEHVQIETAFNMLAFIVQIPWEMNASQGLVLSVKQSGRRFIPYSGLYMH